VRRGINRPQIDSDEQGGPGVSNLQEMEKGVGRGGEKSCSVTNRKSPYVVRRE